MRNLVLAFGLSALTALNSPALAVDLLDDGIIDAPKVAAVVEPIEENIVQPSLYQRIKDDAYNKFDRVGAVDLACGTSNCLMAGGRTIKDVGHVGIAVADTVAAIGNVAVAPFMLAYESTEAAKKSISNAKDYFLAAGSNLKTAAEDMPKNYENMKTGLSQLYSGAKKASASIYDAVTSESVQSTASKVWNGAKNVGSKILGWFSQSIFPSFDNVDFS